MNQEKIKQVKDQINQAYILLSGIPVKGDSVDIMAQAKGALKGAFRLLEENDETA